jgi:NitT/TauT family transport system permease protein
MRVPRAPWWQKGLAILAALAVWEVASLALNQSLLLVGPWTAVRQVFRLAGHADFWSAVGFSLSRIFGGFLAGFIVAFLLAGAAYRFRWARTLAWPWLAAIKSTPVASIIILVLIWVGSRELSVIICFLIVVPIVYENVLSGLDVTNRELKEVALVFGAGFWQRVGYLYLPQLKPFLTSALRTSLGMSWKAGIAAEVIGIPDGSIGERLYEAKVYLSSADLFAWTLVVIAASIIFEKIILLLVRSGYRALGVTD